MGKQCFIDWFFLLFKRRAVCVALCLLSFPTLFSQKYFNDTLWFGATSNCILTMTLPTDSGIYVAGAKADIATGARAYPVIGFVDSLGNSRVIHESYDVDNDQIVYGSYYKLFLNTEGNFVLAYANGESGLEYPRVKEITPQGQLIRDIKLDTIIDMGLFVLDLTSLYQHKDSSYWLWSVTSFVENEPPSTQKAGPLLTILHPDFSVDTIIRYYFDPNKKWDYYFTDEVELDSGKTAVMILCSKIGANPNNLEDAYMRLLIFDREGNIFHEYIDNPLNVTISSSPSLIKSLENDGYVMHAYICEGANDSTKCRTYLAKYNYSLGLQWQTSISNTVFIQNNHFIYSGPKRVIATSDSNYLSVCIDFPLNGFDQSATLISKVSPVGEILWERNFYYFDSILPVFNGYYYDVTDVRECPDGGFAFPGQVSGNSIQTGWLVKTNCLGFLGPPEAAFAYKNSKTADSTFFYNTSIQAGNYHWDFGDGTSYDTGENEDTLLHQYADTGVYHATLIAYGCNGETDTLRFDVHASPQKDSVLQAGEGYFAFYPNPIVSGGMLYVYINGANEGKASTIELTFYDTAGKTAQNTRVSSKEGNYLIQNTLSSGMYFVHLTQNGNNIAVKKLVVK